MSAQPLTNSDANAIRDLILDQGRAQAERDGAIKEQIREVRSDVRVVDGKVVDLARELGNMGEWKRITENMTAQRLAEWTRWREQLDERFAEVRTEGKVTAARFALILGLAGTIGGVVTIGLEFALKLH